MKKCNFKILIILLILLVVGCSRGSHVVVKGSEINTPTKMSMDYYRFTGYKQTNINVKEGKTVDVTIDIVTDEGTLDAYIAKSNDKNNCAYEGKDIPTSNFTVRLSEKGRYTIRIDAKKHSGSYSITWQK